MNLQIAVVDDIQQDIDIVKNMAKQYFSENSIFQPVITEYLNADDFLKDYTKDFFKIVFVDICIGEVNGIQLSQRLRRNDKDIIIIFISTTTEFVFQTFRAVPHGYLCKPYSFEEFSETMDRVVEKVSYQPHELTVKIPRNEEKIYAENIMTVITDDHYLNIKMITGQAIRSISTYSEIAEKLLPLENFVECNRGIIINVNYVVSFKGCDVAMQDGKVYPVRRQDRKKLSEMMIKLISNKGGFFS